MAQLNYFYDHRLISFPMFYYAEFALPPRLTFHLLIIDRIREWRDTEGTCQSGDKKKLLVHYAIDCQ